MQKSLIYLLVVMMLISGCTSTKQISSIELSADNKQSIAVSMNDGRLIRFRVGDYSVNIDSETLQGKGKIILDRNSGRFEEFEGTIRLEEIQKITTTETTTIFYIAFGGTVLLVAYILIMSGLASGYKH